MLEKSQDNAVAADSKIRLQRAREALKLTQKRITLLE